MCKYANVQMCRWIKVRLHFCVLFFLILFFHGNVSAQDSLAITGKWFQCEKDTFISICTCDTTGDVYQFNTDGTIGDKKYKQPIYFMSTWKYHNDKLMIYHPQIVADSVTPRTYIVIWFDKNHFYSVMHEKENGAATYYYFSRIL